MENTKQHPDLYELSVTADDIAGTIQLAISAIQLAIDDIERTAEQIKAPEFFSAATDVLMLANHHLYAGYDRLGVVSDELLTTYKASESKHTI